MKPRPLFSSVAVAGPTKMILAIGQTQEQGPVVCYTESSKGRHTETVHLYGGVDSYEMWRAYMTELGDWQRTKQLQSVQQPRASEVEKALEAHPHF